MDKQLTAIIFNIQRGCIHDGPGIRTAVFFKGCPLRCAWCCNPESQRGSPELSFTALRCIRCGRCTAACHYDAIDQKANPIAIDRTSCAGCAEKPCSTVCPAKALEVLGYTVSLSELTEQINRDRAFYRRSNGGVTLSGGEALLFPDFSASLLEVCKAQGFHTAIETCLHVPQDNIRMLLPYTDLFLCDIKHTDRNKFYKFTGGDIELVIQNLKCLSDAKADVLVRVPLIPGFNADKTTLSSICELVRQLGFTEMNLLKYHRLGLAKYEQLGRECSMFETRLTDDKALVRLAALPERYGIRAAIGG